MLKSKIAATRAVILWVGIVFLIIGAGLWLFTSSIIQGHEQVLSHPNLSEQDKWRYEGSLKWWRGTSMTLYYPMAAILIAIGFVAIILLILLR